MPKSISLSAKQISIYNQIKRLRSSSFIKNVLIVMTGTTASQLIGFVLAPVISRLFSPSDFGIFGSFGAIWGIAAAGVTLQYSQAIMLPKDKEDAANLFFVSMLSSVAVFFIIMAICFIMPDTMNNLMKTTGIWALILLIAATLISGLNLSFQAWCVRIKAFKHTSASQVVRSLSSNGAQIGFGIFNFGAAGLIISAVLGNIFASINLVRVLYPDILALSRKIRWVRIKQLAKEYIDFPMYSASQNIINALSSGLPVLLLTYYFDIMVAGAYAFGMRMLEAPMGFISTALRQVLFQKAAETQHREESLVSLYVKVSFGLFAIAVFPTIVLVIWAPQIFSWMFGSDWQIAGYFAQVLVIWLMFVFCNTPAVLFARLIRIQREVFIYDLVLLAARITALVFGGIYLSALGTIMLFAFVGAAMNLALIFLVGYAVMKKEGQVSEANVLDSLLKQ